MVGAWADFIVFKVLPTASGQLLVWFNEWQGLIVGLLVLVAGSIWTRALVRSNRRTAYLISQSLRIMTEAFAESSRNVADPPARRALEATPNAETPQHDLEFRLDRLRRVIRGALSVIPQTNDRVDPNVAKLLQNISNFSLEGQVGQNALTEQQRSAMADVEKCISDLRSGAMESMRCAEAWDALVRLHRAARILRDAAAEQPQERAA